MAEGVDLYGLYNKVTDWNAVAESGIEFAYIKLSDGYTARDDYGYVDAAKKVGIKVGGYHYAQFGDPVAQADYFIERCKFLFAVDLAPALDLESPFTPDNAAVDFAVRFLHRVRERGHRPCLYANNTMLSVIEVPVKNAVPETIIWAARYSTEAPTVPYDVWQYTSSGEVSGISMAVDRSKGEIPLNWRATGWPSEPAPAPATTDIPTLYGGEMIRVPKGGTKDAPANFPIPVSMLREHDIVIAPGNMPVVLFHSYNWAWNTGTGGDPGEHVIPVKGSFSFIVPKGAGKADLIYWADDDFTVGVYPR